MSGLQKWFDVLWAIVLAGLLVVMACSSYRPDKQFTAIIMVGALIDILDNIFHNRYN